MQRISTSCDAGAQLSGGFRLHYLKYTTRTIPHDASARDVAEAIVEVSTLDLSATSDFGDVLVEALLKHRHSMKSPTHTCVGPEPNGSGVATRSIPR